MSGDRKLIRLIEEIAANSWPAQIQQTLGAWRLRANMDVTKRANSVYTSGPFPEDDDWMEIIVDFYRRRSLTPCFYISEASPAELDGILESAGYQKCFECFTMVASCKEVINRTERISPFTCEFLDEASSEWIHDFLRLEGYSIERYQGYDHIFSAIGPRKAFVILLDNGELIALGTVVVERGWAGLSNIIVDPKHRGKGAATAVIRALAEWSLTNDAERFYLQVLKDNPPALALYSKLGFSPLYEYHYRLLNT